MNAAPAALPGVVAAPSHCRDSPTQRSGPESHLAWPATSEPTCVSATRLGCRRRTSLLCLGALLPALWALVASAGAAEHRSLEFTRLSTGDGLSHGVVYGVCQDSRGFLWFATENGLSRFDGYSFVALHHDPDNPSSPSDNNIGTVAADRNGHIWFGTWGGGVNRFDPEAGTFEHFRHAPEAPGSLSDDRIQTVYFDAEGELWLGTFSGGLEHYDRSSGSFVHHRHSDSEPSSLAHNRVFSVVDDRAGALWVATGGGLDRLDRASGRFTHYRHDPTRADSLASNVVRDVTVDRGGVVWVATEGGLDRFEPAQGRFSHFVADRTRPGSLSSNAVNIVFEDSNGSLWVGTVDGGLNRFLPETGTFEVYSSDPKDPESIGHANIRDIYEDRSGNLWVSTRGGGVAKANLKPTKFRHVTYRSGTAAGLTDSNVRSICEDHTGILWVGTENGLNRLDEPGGTTTHFLPTGSKRSVSYPRIYAAVEDRLGRMWFGTYGGGLERWDRTSGLFSRFRHSAANPRSLSHDRVKALLVDAGGELWVGTDGGLARFISDSAGFETFTHRPDDSGSLASNYVWTVYEDSDRILWVGTDHGLARFDRGTRSFRTFRKDPDKPRSLSNNKVLCLFEDANKVLWVGTAGGLNRMSGRSEQFDHFLEQDGLPSSFVTGILPDAEGRLWVATNGGLTRFEPGARTFRNYDMGDGLQSNDFYPGACAMGRDGQLYFGGTNGFNAFLPAEVRDSTFVPPVVLTSFKVFDREVKTALAIWSLPVIVLGYQENFFAFEFSALDYTNPAKNRYAYMLEGFDRDWVVCGTRRYASYTNLDAGSYTFRVRGTNPDGVWATRGAAIKVRVVPPPWKTWWAYAGYVALVLTAVFTAIDLERQRHQRRLAEKLRDLTRALTSTLDVNEVLDRLLERLHTVVRYDSAAVVVRDGDRFRVISRRGSMAGEDSSEPEDCTLEAGLLRDLLAQRRPLLRPERGATSALGQEQAHPLWRSWLGLPLESRDEVVALLVLRHHLVRAFTQHHADLGATFAGQAAMAIENAKMFGEIKRLAATDPLTGLSNRRQFFELAVSELDRARRYERPLCAVMVDIDHFKRVNDQHGHAVGDRVLQEVARRLRDTVRKSDTVARYGGEEFALLMPETDAPAALTAAERVRAAVATTPISVGEPPPLEITISAGVAAIRPDDRMIEALLERADIALYAAKNAGRNRVCSA